MSKKLINSFKKFTSFSSPLLKGGFPFWIGTSLAILALSTHLYALEATSILPVDLNVNSKFTLSINDALPTNGSASREINFGTISPSESKSFTKIIEIYCTSNTGHDWQIDIQGEALACQEEGDILRDCLKFRSWAPIVGDQNFQQAKGECFEGIFPTDTVLYKSAPSEMGSDILIALALDANIDNFPRAGSYSSRITLSMHE